MCELCQLDAIFLAQETFIMPSFLDIVDLDRSITGRRHDEATLVIVIY